MVDDYDADKYNADKYDVVLYGATGFTGRQTALYFQTHAPAGLRWAVAGRNKGRLESIAAESGAHGAIVADSTDIASVEALVARSRVVLTTAGPFSKYGDPVVDACAAQGKDYVDITGETPWVKRVIDRHHGSASRAGTRIIPLCGFDSIPSDIGTLLCVQELAERHGQATARVVSSFKMAGGLNGGTIASALHMAESGDARTLGDTLLLNPEDRRAKSERARSRDVRSITWDPIRKTWLAPFVMGPVNSRVVRRSNALEAQWGQAYGDEFTYRETMELKSHWKARMASFGLMSFTVALSKPLGRGLIKRLTPAPGEGPTQEQMDGGFFRARFVADGTEGARIMVTLSVQGDPGNRATVMMLCESALLLATADRATLPGGAGRGGVLTPATGLGMPLVERMKNAGLSISIQKLA